MKNLKYAVLTSSGMFVNESFLEKGVYATTIPTLHRFDTKIEDIRAQIIAYGKHIAGYSTNKALEALSHCEIEIIELSIVDP